MAAIFVDLGNINNPVTVGNFARLPGGIITVQSGNSGNTIDAASLSAAHAVIIDAGSQSLTLSDGTHITFQGFSGLASANFL